MAQPIPGEWGQELSDLRADLGFASFQILSGIEEGYHLR
jgi:hypothetical protein